MLKTLTKLCVSDKVFSFIHNSNKIALRKNLTWNGNYENANIFRHNEPIVSKYITSMPRMSNLMHMATDFVSRFDKSQRSLVLKSNTPIATNSKYGIVTMYDRSLKSICDLSDAALKSPQPLLVKILPRSSKLLFGSEVIVSKLHLSGLSHTARSVPQRFEWSRINFTLSTLRMPLAKNLPSNRYKKMKNLFSNEVLFLKASRCTQHLHRKLYCTLGHVLIGGGTGFIGSNLREILLKEKYKVTVISRVKTGEKHVLSWGDIIQNGIPDDISAVVNLNGAPIMVPFKYFGRKYKQDIWTSRVGSTVLLADIIKCAKYKPNVFISVTRTDIYPSYGVHTEDFHPSNEMINNNFFTNLGFNWENAKEYMPTEVRHVVIRTGTVLGYGGGFIKQLYYPTHFGLAAKIGNGCQFQPWIHMCDLTYLILFAIENKQINGILNGVSPERITNGHLTTMYAQMFKKSANHNVPSSILMTIYGRERSKLLLEGRQVIPKRTLNYGFQFVYWDIEKALKHLLII